MDKRYSRSEFLFFTAYILWLVFAVINLTYLKGLMPYKVLNGYVEKVVLGILLVKFLDDDRYGWRGIIGILVVGILYLVSLRAEAPGMMIPIYFIFSARNIDYRDIFKVTLVIQLSMMAVSVVCSLQGVILNEVWDEDTRARYSLGYTFCTYGSHISFFLTLLYMSLRKKLNLLETFVLLAWNFIWYKATNTRIDLLLCVPAIVVCYGLSKLKFEVKDNWFYRIVFMAAGPVMAGVAIAGQWFYKAGSPLWEKLNSVLNGRLFYGHEAIQNYGFSFWGQYIKWIGRGGIRKHPDWIYNYVDCSYLKYLLHYGIFFFAIFMLAIVLVGKSLPKKKNTGLCIGFVFWLAYGMVDAELFELAFQPFLLLLGCICKEEFQTEKRKAAHGKFGYSCSICGMRFKKDIIKWRF